MSENVIELIHLQKQFGDHAVLHDINLSVKKGEVLSIIGASGSGKSTMLRCINLLETPTSGQIMFHGKDITSPDFHITKYRTKVGMVFQSFNLFPQYTALKNVTLARELLAQEPGFAPAWNNLALALFDLKEYEQAVEAADKARELGFEVSEGFLEELKPHRQ